MHTALLKLMRLQIKAWLRRQFAGGSTRRTVFGILGVAMFGLWMTGVALSAAVQKPKSPDEILALLPIYLVAFLLFSIVVGNDDRAIAFSPAEIDALFPGPFTRRDLVLYKLIKQVLGSLAGGAIFGFMLRRFAGTLPAGIAGAALSLIFINVITTIIALGRAILDERFYKLARLGALLLLIAAAVGVAMMVKTNMVDTINELKRIAETPTVSALFAPARVFAHVFAARSLVEIGLWSLPCIGMIGAAVLGVLTLDRGYAEAALVASQRRQARVSRMTRGIAVSPGVRIRRVPGLGALGAPGAIVRRQLITALRTSRAWMIIFVIAVGYSYVVSRILGNIKAVNGAPAMAGAFPGLLMLVIMLPQMLRFDFRADLDHMDLLKSLPLSAGAITLAQLAVPTAILSLQVWAIIGAATTFMGLPPTPSTMAALAAVPVGLLIIALENVVFLYVPTRSFAPGQAAMVFSGRRVVMMLARAAMLGVGGVLVGGVGAAVWTLSASVWGTFAACWGVVFLLAAALTCAAARAFIRFDVSADMPA